VFESQAIGVLSALILAFSKLHVMSGSSELPRAVSTVFVLFAFSLLNARRDTTAPIVAGAALGIAAAMRFSEEVFLVPALFQLARERPRAIVLMTVSFTLVALMAIGISDWAYWGEAFSSLHHMVDYTLVRGQSSRGYQPFYEYAVHMTAWSDVPTVAMALFAIRLAQWRVAAWTWLPIVVLSLLPHKEPRYLIPVLPFVSMSAAVTLWHAMESFGWSTRRNRVPMDTPRWASALLLACLSAFAWEAAGFNFIRSEAAVRLAQYLGRQHAALGGGAVEQLWRMGGHLYFPPTADLYDLDPGRMNDQAYVTQVFADVHLRWAAIDEKDARAKQAVMNFGFREIHLPAEAPAGGYSIFIRDGNVQRR
jgi:hypothetical protein